MSVTDQAVLTEVQYALVEPTVDGGVTWSALWTASEVITALNRRQSQFLKETAALVTRTTLVTIPNTTRHTLPADWLVTISAAWQRPDGTSYPLWASTEFEADAAAATWEYGAQRDPLASTEVELPTLQIQVLPPSSDAGQIDLLYTALGAALSNTGVPLTVPDDCVWIVKWGVLAELLNNVGRSADPQRAAYAERRYRLGVQLVQQILIGGWY